MSPFSFSLSFSRCDESGTSSLCNAYSVCTAAIDKRHSSGTLNSRIARLYGIFGRGFFLDKPWSGRPDARSRRTTPSKRSPSTSWRPVCRSKRFTWSI